MTTRKDRDKLHTQIDQLNNAELIVVNRFVDSVLASIRMSLRDNSWLVTRSWAEMFITQLKAHHALQPDPLSRKAFEHAFNASCEAAGFPTYPSKSMIHRFFDTSIDLPEKGLINLSLKASSAQKMKEDTIHISKLTEAAWIQDVRTQAERYKHIVELFEEYQQRTNLIMMLRAFSDEHNILKYELTEIPTSIFATVNQLNISQAQAATIKLPPGASSQDAIARIRVDRSDAKITVTGIKKKYCIVHGLWWIPIVLQHDAHS